MRSRAHTHAGEDQSGAGSARHRLRLPLSTPDVPPQSAGGPLSFDSVPSKEASLFRFCPIEGESERISCPEAATLLLHPLARARMHACRRMHEAWTAGIESEASMGPKAYTARIPIASRRLTDEASIGHQGRTVCIRLYRHTLPAPADARSVHPHIALRLQVGAPLDERFDVVHVALDRGGNERRPSVLQTRRGGRAQHSKAFSSGRATLRGRALQHHHAY
jgi:hypothetical protein